MMVFQDQTKNHGVSGINLVSNESIPIWDQGSAHMVPRIVRNIVVWTDVRNGSDGNIFGYDLDANQVNSVDTNPKHQKYPVTNGNVIAWVEQTDQYGGSLVARVLRTGTVFTVASNVHQSISPGMCGNYVVWVELGSFGPSGLYGCNLKSRS